MSSAPVISGWGYAQATVSNVGDLIALAKWCTNHRVDHQCVLDADGHEIVITLVDTDSGYMIECGDHYVNDYRYDILLPTHQHEDDEDTTVCDRCGEADSLDTYHLHNLKYLCRACYAKQAPNNLEEALEEALDRQRVMLDRDPPAFDWPAKDKRRAR